MYPPGNGKRRGEFNSTKMKSKAVANLLAVWDNEENNTAIAPYHISRSLKANHLDAHLTEVLQLADTKKNLKDAEIPGFQTGEPEPSHRSINI